MSEERLTLVTDFGKLKAGDLVVLRPCAHCRQAHRGMLISPDGVGGLRADGSLDDSEAFPLLPGRCRGNAVVGWGYIQISTGAVADRRVYLVDTGLDRQETHEAAQGAPRSETAHPDAVRRELATTGS